MWIKNCCWIYLSDVTSSPKELKCKTRFRNLLIILITDLFCCLLFCLLNYSFTFFILVCADGFDIVNKSLGSCYALMKTIQKWGDARTFCEERNSHLVNVGSQGEQDFLVDTINNVWGNFNNNNNNYWVILSAFSMYMLKDTLHYYYWGSKQFWYFSIP